MRPENSTRLNQLASATPARGPRRAFTAALKLFALAALCAGSALGGSGQAKAAPPSCVQNLLSGLQNCACGNSVRQGTLVIHRKDNAWVSYSATYFCKNASGDPFTPANISQQFSDRWNVAQNFDKTDVDSQRITINATTGQVTIENLTWGFTTTLSNVTCSGNIINGSTSGELYSISFGSLMPLPC